MLFYVEYNSRSADILLVFFMEWSIFVTNVCMTATKFDHLDLCHTIFVLNLPKNILFCDVILIFVMAYIKDYN